MRTTTRTASTRSCACRKTARSSARSKAPGSARGPTRWHRPPRAAGSAGVVVFGGVCRCRLRPPARGVEARSVEGPGPGHGLVEPGLEEVLGAEGEGVDGPGQREHQPDVAGLAGVALH